MFRKLAALKRSADICHIYDDPDHSLTVASEFIEDGLARGEHCVYLLAPADALDVVSALRGVGVDIASRSASRNPHAGGHCAPAAQISDARGEGAAARIAGLRLVVDYGCASAHDLLDVFDTVRTLIKQWFGRAPRILVLDQFDRLHTPADILDVALCAHPYVLLGDQLCRNVFWDPPDRSGDDLSRRRDRLEWRLGQLEVLAPALSPTGSDG